MKRIVFVLLGLSILVWACKKKEVAPVAGFTASQYFFPLKTGNYWVYQRVDTTFSAPDTAIDTVSITSDTLINGITYYYITGGTFEGFSGAYYGDSAGTIVTLAGNLKLSDIRNDTLAQFTEGNLYIVQRVGNPDTLINVIAGAFTSIQTITDTYYPPADVPVPASNPRHNYHYYTKGLGLAYCTNFFVSSPFGISMQLINYHIAS